MKELNLFSMLVKVLKWSWRIVRDNISSVRHNPSIKACSLMALALCFTFVGYEYARTASITLLAAKETNLGSEALPLTVAVGSPTSALILYLYTKSIRRYGSSLTLRYSYLLCICIFLLVLFYSQTMKGVQGQVIVVCFYAFREIYISLLSSQQWAFISTSLDKSTSSYLVSFSGIVSIASAIGGCTVERLVNLGGVHWLLISVLLSILGAWCCTEGAQSIVTEHNMHADKPLAKPTPKPEAAAKKKAGFWSDSYQLISSHRILQLLFCEAVCHQLCTNMLNIMFHNGLRESAVDDEMRARLVGRFFATVNIVVVSLQCLVLPSILSCATLPIVLNCLPVVVLFSVSVGMVYPSVTAVMIGFGSMKVLEYSVMNAATEMIYVPLGHEVRYLGKELIKFFGHKLGKSLSSVVISTAIHKYQPSLQQQSIWGLGFTVVWGAALLCLSKHLVDQEQSGECAAHAGTTGPKKIGIKASRSMPLFEVPVDEEDEEENEDVRNDWDGMMDAIDKLTGLGIPRNSSSKSSLYRQELVSRHSRGSLVLLDEPGPVLRSRSFTNTTNEDDNTTVASESPPLVWYGRDSHSDETSRRRLESEELACLSKVPFSAKLEAKEL